MTFSQQVESVMTTAILALVITGVAAIASRAIEGHHSISWEAKDPLIKKYGLWAVNRAEAFCPENDVACVEREAKRLYEVYKYRRGL